MLLTPAVVWGAPGDLDPSFGIGGVVTTVMGTGMQLDAHASAVVLQPDGKIVAAGFSTDGRVALARYMPDGSLDTSFGLSGGTVATSMGRLSSIAFAIALQPDGNIVVVGTASNYQPCGPVGSPLNVSNLILARYTPDGSLDASFGLSGGTVATVIPCTNVSAFDGALQEDGKIVAAGALSNDSSPSAFLLARYTPDGSLDPSFGSGGMLTTAIGNLDSAARAIALQQDGQIVVAGYSEAESGNTQFALARYAPDGSLDGSFGGGGTVTTAIGPSASIAFGIALQSDGKIVAAGSAGDASFNSVFALARYTPEGTLDPSFGSGGIVTTAIGPFGEGRAVALQPDGKIVVVGFGYDPDAGHGMGFALVRYTPDGSLDTSFGSGGIVTTAVGSLATATAVALQPDGRIVAAGGRYGSWALARYFGYACPEAPRLCRTAAKSYFLERNKSDSAKDKLLWRWRKGTSTSQAELGDPTATADYALCLYSGTPSALVSESFIPAGASRWRVLGTTGYRYNDRTAAAGGITRVVLKGSAQNRSSVRVRGKGAALPLLPRPVTAPLTIQLVNLDNELCWDASFSDSQLLENDAGKLKARAP